MPKIAVDKHATYDGPGVLRKLVWSQTKKLNNPIDNLAISLDRILTNRDLEYKDYDT